jgi:hypothetical protein
VSREQASCVVLDHLVVVPYSLSAQLAHKRGVRPPGFISAGKHEGVKDS